MTIKVKICGLKTLTALKAALDAGADYVGLVFFPPSPRCVDLQTARRIAATARHSGRAQSVALVVDADDALLGRVAQEVCPDLLQLHGEESPERVRHVRRSFGLPIMKALPVQSREDVLRADDYLEPGRAADLILFDAKPAPGAALPGGNGLAFDWHILEAVERRFPFALSGGLNPDNVAEAIRLTGAAIVDVSSGVERAAGEKDPDLIRRFITAAKSRG